MRHEQGCTIYCEPTCNLAHRRMALESRVIRRFIREARADGWAPFAVWNGEERILVTTVSTVLEEVTAVDESAIQFRHLMRNRRSFVAVVLGNGIDCLVDCGDQLSATYDRVSNIVEGWE